jgi:hypothetical protein
MDHLKTIHKSEWDYGDEINQFWKMIKLHETKEIININ